MLKSTFMRYKENMMLHRKKNRNISNKFILIIMISLIENAVLKIEKKAYDRLKIIQHKYKDELFNSDTVD